MAKRPEMTIGDLRELIADQPDDKLLVLSSDSEGNYYSPAIDHGFLMWNPKEKRIRNPDEVALCDKEDYQHVFVLWP